jgi:predicted PurR-regulated permease PerM
MNVPWRRQVAIVLFWAGLALLAYLVFLILEPFLNPLGWAAIIALVFYPVHERFARRWGPARAAALSTVTATVVVVVPLLLVMTAFARETVTAVSELQQGLANHRFAWLERAWAELVQRIPGNQRADVMALANDAIRRIAIFLAAQSGSVLRNTAGFIFDLFIALFATFFLLRDSAIIAATIRRLLPIEPRMRERLIAQTRELVSIGVTSALVVAATQGLLGGLVFAAVGIDAAVFWGVVMAFFCLLPFGAWIIWLPAAILLAANGSIGRALIVAGLGAGIVSAVDNVLRPMLISGRSSLNGLMIFLSLLGGIAAFGAIGIVLGPLVLATAIALLKTYVQPSELPEHDVVGPTGS